MQTLKYRPFEHDDWGMIRNEDGRVFATVRRPCSEGELAEHRTNGTDPFEELALKLIAAFTRPAAPVFLTTEDGECNGNENWEGPLTDEEQGLIDAAWETHKAAKPAPVEGLETGEINRIAELLLDAWKKADPQSSVALHSVSYIATFVDMAKSIIEDRNTCPAAPVECHPRDTKSVECHETRNVTAKTVEGLVILERVSKYPHGTYFGKDVPEGTAVVAYSQAEAIIAAERATRKFWENRENEALKRAEKAEADNAALTARVEASEKEVDRLQMARVFDGWLYRNPDTGTEWAEQHPIVSGEVPDATEVRAATATAFQNELIPAWEDLAKETSRRKALEIQLAAARKALEPFSKFAGALFERNFNDPDVVDRISAADGGVLQLTAKEFFEARAALEARP